MTPGSPSRLRRLAAASLALAALLLPRFASAQATSPTTITVTGGAQPSSQTAPTGQVQFGLRVPLKPNAENVLTLVAADQLGQSATVTDLKIAQITLTDVVRAKVTATRLSTPEVRQLVAQGVIDIADPANYNVSRFVVVLTVGGQQVQVPVPVVRHIEETFAEGPPVSVGCGSALSTSGNSITLPCGGGGGGSAQDTPPLHIIPFEAAPAGPGLPAIPGVIIIEGRIKTLKEFFKVDLLLMNVSSIFTLTDLTARLDVPAGDLTPVAPAGGGIVLPDLAPGTDTTGNFIVRGDTKGVHTVTAHFGGKIVGSFLPAPVPFSGSASTDLEVKGAPKLDVRVSHPDFVIAGQPYDLTVTIENTDPELDALYASMALDVGAGANLLDEVTGQQIDGPVARNLGDILKGQSITQTYTVMPLTTGAIISCVGAADANINLSVEFMANGPACAIGTLPSTRTNADGKPTVTVVPAHNTAGVNPATAIVALFSDQMIEPTITAGYSGASFTVESAAGGVIGGTLTFADIFGGTSAIFQPSSPLAPDTVYTITVNPSVFNTAGLSLASGIVARFTTSAAPPTPDTTAPAVALAVQPPFTATAISRGQSVPIAASATDAQGVARVDLLLDGALIDAKKAAPALTFLVDTAGLAAGSTHVLEAQAYDLAGNVGTTTLSLQVAPDLQPPTATIAANALVGQGRMLPLEVQATDDGRVARVDVFVDSVVTPFATGLVEPFQFALDTTGLSGGAHVLRAVVEDGAGNQTQATKTFTVTADGTAPALALLSPQGTTFRGGAPMPFAVQASDDTAVAAITYTLDAETTPRGSGDSLTLDTAALALGPHVMTIVAADASNNRTTVAFSFTLTAAPVDTTPPPPVATAALSLSTLSPGIVAITGGAGAAEVGARVVFTNQTTLAGANAVASATGSFAVQIDAAGGDAVAIVAIDAAGNTSAPVTVTVPVPATLVSLVVTPSTVALTRSHTSEQLGVVGTFSDLSQQVLTNGLTFTSSAPSVASVTTSGLVLPGANGIAVITVASPSAGVTPVQVPVTVNFSTVVGLSASPSPLPLVGLGRSQRLSVSALYSDSTTGTFGGSVRFATANPAVAIVDGTGLVTSTGVGTTSISLASTGLPTIQVLVTVSAVQPTGLVVTPTSLAMTSLGQAIGLTVQFQYSDGTIGAGTSPVTYQSLDPAVATVSGAGIVTAAGEGVTSIVVSTSGFVANVAVSVSLPTTLPPPVITSLGRPIAGEGDALVVLGRNFAGAPTQNFATINGLRAPVIGAADDRLILQVPEGATTGPVQVRVAGQSSNTLNLDVYARIGRTRISGTPFQATPGPGQSVGIGSATFSLHPGDTAVVAADPNTINGATWSGLLPPVVTGRLVLTVNGADVILTPGGQPIDITSYLPSVSQATPITLALRVEESGGVAAAGALALIAGPANTGAFVGLRFTTGNTIGEQTVIRFRTAAADGAKFAVTSQNWYRLDGGFGNGSQGGGSFVGAASTPNDGSFRTYTAHGGEVVVTYDDAGVFADVATPGQIVIAMVPADAGGSRTTHIPVAEARLVVTSLDSATIVPQQTSVLADGVNRPVAVDVTGVRDHVGNLVPDGTTLAMTVQTWYRRVDGGFGNGSAGGALSGGISTPNDGSFRSATLAGGAAQLIYTIGGATLGSGTTDTVVFAAVPAFGNGSRVAARPFGEGTMVRSAPSSSGGSAVAVPATLSAVSADNRSVITLTGLTDSLGHIVPDGTMVAVTAENWYRMSDGGFGNGSFGGTIVGGITSPNDGSFRAFPVQGGSVTFTYSNAGLVLNDSATATTVIAILPAFGNGSRIGSTPFAEVRIAQGGLTTGTIVATPASTLADGARRPVAIAITDLRDALGNLVPDGTRIALTAAEWYRMSDGGYGNGSAGGVFIDGATTPNDGSFRTYTVVNGRVDATYSPETVSPFTPNDFRSAIISAVVANGSGSRTTVVPFSTGAVALSSAQVGQITASPLSLYTDTQSRTSTIRLTGLTDGQGVPVPDGTNVALTATNWYRSDGTYGNGSLGGSMLGGGPTPNDGSFRSYAVTGGAVTATYSNIAQFVDVGNTANAVISVLPATATASRVGVIPITTTSVTLAGADTGTVLGGATVTPNGSLSLTLTNLRDTAGNPIPDGSLVAITATNWYDRAGAFGNGSVGGTIGGGIPTPNDGSFRSFTVTGGQVTFTFTAGNTPNTTAVISVLPAGGTGSRLAVRPFITHAVRVQ